MTVFFFSLPRVPFGHPGLFKVFPLRGKYHNQFLPMWQFRGPGVNISKYSFAGKRIAVLLDVGRILTRVPQKTSGEHMNKKEKRQFDTEWRGPRLYTICEYDDNGKPGKDTRRYCDGTCDAN